MNELIQVAERQIGDGTIQTVNARDLHAFLGVGKDFSNWMKDRIQQYGFVENQDFVVGSPVLANLDLFARQYWRMIVSHLYKEVICRVPQ